MMIKNWEFDIIDPITDFFYEKIPIKIDMKMPQDLNKFLKQEKSDNKENCLKLEKSLNEIV